MSTRKNSDLFSTLTAIAAFASALLIGPTVALILWSWVPLVIGALVFTAIIFTVVVVGVITEHKRRQAATARRSASLIDTSALRRLADELRRGDQ